jgi:hypothetical protein
MCCSYGGGRDEGGRGGAEPFMPRRERAHKPDRTRLPLWQRSPPPHDGPGYRGHEGRQVTQEQPRYEP